MPATFCPYCSYGCPANGFCACQKPVQYSARRLHLLNLATAIQMLSLPATPLRPGETILLMPPTQ